MSLAEQVRRIKDIEAIESDSFVPQAFKSSRDGTKVTEASEIKKEAETIKEEVTLLPTAIMYNDSNTLAHPNLFMDKEEAERLWLNRLISLRQERLMGSPQALNHSSSAPAEEKTPNLHASFFLSNGPTWIGSVYKKALYRQYTDESYSTEIPKPHWLGFLGPILRAEVGDVIVVHMKNFASRPYSLHPHGVFYEKNSEGALYPDGTTGRDKSDDAVAPGESYTYTWHVKPEYAPTEADASCLTWIYHSHGDAPKDIASGLIGALLTCKQAINGYVYGNLPALKVCVGRPVSWHLFGIAGMQSFYEVLACGSSASPTETPGKERRFYIAAEEMVWYYAPSGVNYMTDASLTDDSDSESYFSRDGGKLGGKYLKARYISYTDDTFTTKTHIAGSDVHLGILGPVIRAEAGDVIIVTFHNRATRDYSIQPHGLHYEKAYEGAKYQDGTQKPGVSVAPGEKFVYRWRVIEGPSSSDPACLSYLYYSAVDPVRDTNSGLFGPIQVCKKGVLDGSGHQYANKIQHEFFLLFSVMDENENWYLEKNIEEFGSSDLSVPANEEFQESNKMHAVNGYMYGNLPGLDLCNGEHTMWHILGLGTEVDIYGIYFEGNTFQRDGMNRDTLSVFPHTTVTVSMTPDNDGQFELSCLTGDHYQAGMRQHYEVKSCSAKTPAAEHFTSTVRYYIAAEEVEWNYAPDQIWELEKYKTILKESPGSIYLKQSENQIGAKYKKVVFREYTDESFTRRKPRIPEEEHLEIMGPIIRAEDLMSGLVGPLIVCRKNTLNTNRHRKDIDKEFALLFMVFDENMSHYLDENIKTYLNTDPEKFDKYDGDFMESNKMHGINGKLYANLHGLNMTENDKTEWYLIGLGNEVDMHTVHFHAQSFIYRMDHPHRAGVYGLFPGTFQTIEMTAGSPGQWLLHCHVTDHIYAGMETLVTVYPKGSVYKKALYRQYTDESYSTEIPKPDWLGFLGPILRAEVGDVIVVHMKNFASRPYSLHPHGVFYEKNSEGALYPDGTTGRDKSDDAVAPGESYTYTWHVKPEYAPTEADASCLTWIYHSHGDAPKDIASGLIGALLTCKQAINGYVYGNLPALKVCIGRPVSWHLFSIGNEVDIHSAYFHGHTLMDRMHRTDVLSLFPATSVTATMIPRTEGKWLLSCQVNDHVQAGMQSFYEVSACESSASPTETPGKERRFYIAAEEMIWDYAPSGMNYMTNENLTKPDSDSESYFSRDGGKLGGKYLKARYISYTDDTFATKTHIAGSDEHLGILGTQKAGASVAPGERFVYRWRVLEGPSSSDPACLSYLYYSAVDPVRDTNSGLFGPIQVCKKGVLDGSGHQHANKIQHEFFLLFSVMDENESWYLEKNIEEFGSSDSDPANEEFQDSNKMHTVNGYMYGNLPGLDLCNGEHTMWHILGLGTKVDIHGVYFEGNTFQRDGMNRDTLSVFPHTTVTVSMTPDNDGQFELSCLTGDHYQAGMRQHYEVKSCSAKTPAAEHFSSTVRYYIAAEEVEWNYAPDRTWELEKHKTTPDESPGNVYLKRSQNRIGAKYKKVVFREYTDESFTKRKPRSPEEEHLEIMGPIIRAEVGERIQVVFKNKASMTYSIHAHGVKTSKTHQNGVQPGDMLTYSWTIPTRSGPGPNDPNCITYAYYSSVSLVETDHPHRAGVYGLFPGTFQTIEMTAGSPGQWLLHCHVTDHIYAGMETLVTVHPKG
ncbi:hephaestin 1 [Labeo rohita]|uniref:ferroxidase n=1 Tax=Labeo rohita TaxID=84645 RepID=A0A498MZ17_LABRO|nr:hephaestin 1 [Labeo rohita]